MSEFLKLKDVFFPYTSGKKIKYTREISLNTRRSRRKYKGTFVCTHCRREVPCPYTIKVMTEKSLIGESEIETLLDKYHSYYYFCTEQCKQLWALCHV